MSKKSGLLGTFKGECANADMTNLNGLDITRPVWEGVFASEEYKKGIKLGHYLGFLGHPKDVDCADFKDACIVMTSGHIDNDGKVYGEFNLVDTPVGRVVKSFIDAGVTFGISVRGAGDIINNSVDPETFVFRGFDLVAFPAYPDSIPVFSEIAASTDLTKQKKYQKVCAAVKANIENLSEEAVDVIQPYFAEQSDTYEALEDRRKDFGDLDLTDMKLDGVTALLVEALNDKKHLEAKIEELNGLVSQLQSTLNSERVYSSRKFKTMNRIYADQTKKYDSILAKSAGDASKANIRASKAEKKAKLNLSKFKKAEKLNLKYEKVVATHNKLSTSSQAHVDELEKKLSETVTKLQSSIHASSNLEKQNEKLAGQLSSCKNRLLEYQKSYAQLYAGALGVEPQSLSITASTSVRDLKSQVDRSKGQPVEYDTQVDIFANDSADGLVTV